MADLETSGEILSPTAVRPPGPIREVLASPDFRYFWIAQFLAALGNGALRFVVVWLALDLSTNPAAPGLLGIALGLPAAILMMPAGAWSDRLDRRRLIVATQLAAAVALGLGAAVLWLDAMNLIWAAIFSAVIGGALAIGSPVFQAIVPTLVEPHRLMTGVALQGMGQNAALLFGAMAGGGAIAIAGMGGAFALLGALQLIAAVAMVRVRLGEREPTVRRRMLSEIAQGLRFAGSHEPSRSLLAIALLVGFVWGIVSILLPEIARVDLGVDAFQSSLLFSALGLGLLGMTLVIASRDALRRPGALLAGAVSTILGGCVVVIGLSHNYLLTAVAMFVWGIGGGITLTIQRGLLQHHTPAALMGRMMSLNTLAVIGSFPLAAAMASLLSAQFGPSASLTGVGVVAMVIGALLAWRRPIRLA